jgi:AraC-like DNA-binding protein
MNEFYTIFSIFVTGGLLLACGLMFLFAVIPDNPLLGNYRKARCMMACAYLFFVTLGIVEYLFSAPPPSAHSIAIMQTVTLSIAVSQAFLFTFAMLALLEVRFPGWRYIFREATPPLLFVAAIFTVYICCREEMFGVIFYGFVAVYALLLARYIFLFLASYRRFRLRMDNYFSDMEAGRLRWVVISFFVSLVIGVMALLSAVFMSTLVALLFAVVFDIFYLYFAIRFINYAHQFRTIERAMDEENAMLQSQENEMKGMRDNIYVLLEKRTEEWIAEKGFTEKGVTIDILAVRFYTNSKYLSIYINTHKKQTFREWINGLRIEEAKNLLRQYPEMTMHEIAMRVGFATESHFGQQFHSFTGVSPSGWRKQTDVG